MSAKAGALKGYTTLWVAMAAVGGAAGVAYAVSRKSRHAPTLVKRVTRLTKIAQDGGDLAETGRDMIQRLGIIYEEARKVVEDANELWTQSRKVMRRAA